MSETDPPPAADVDLSDPACYLNRELGELEFQRRVLDEALDDRLPLLERVRFLAIFTRNMDEFFMKRVGGLKQQIDAGVDERTADGRTPGEQWREVHETARPMFEAQADCYREEIRPALADAGIEIAGYDDLSAGGREAMGTYFEDTVLPTLTPLSFDPAHPFPFISNLSLSLGVLTRRDGDDEATFTRIKVPPNQPRLVPVDAASGDGRTYVLLEEVIEANLDRLLPNVEIVDTALFRLTRNAEVRRNEEVAEDLIEVIEEVLEQRRFATAVRMEIEEEMPDRMRELLMDQLELDGREVYERPGPLAFREFEALTDLDRPELKLDQWTPRPHPRLDGERARDALGRDDDERSVFEEIARDDVLLHHPYHSFTETVQRFLDEAANDPDVLAVKAAIYRTASDSKVIQSLIDAAENGKQVAVMVELKARFDEQNNLEWVRKLEENGIHVAYGTVGLKTHTKTALVVREEDDGVQLYSHVGTGNYHSETAKGYVDLGLLTADRDVGQDLVKVFNSFTGPALDEQFRKLLIAPATMREEFTGYVRREAAHARAGRRARIVVKVNGLEDPEMVEELYRASMAGVDVDLIVRDICRLRPGIEGLSENVDVHSIVGRFLEHSRIFYFENGGDPEYYLGSADWMTRNLDNRVEAVAPVEDPAIREQLRFVLELCLNDNRRRWEMNADGSYTHCDPGEDPTWDVQEILMEQTERTSTVRGGRPLGTNLDHPAAPGDLLVEPDPDAPGAESESVPEPESGTAEAEAAGDSAVTDGDGTSGPPTGGAGATGEASADGATTADAGGTSGDGNADADGDLPSALRAHRDRWYVPDSERYAFAVRTPDGDRAYRKTAAGAAAVLERHYG